MIQAKEDFVLVFPKGICGENTTTIHVNPFSVKEVVGQMMKSHELVFGDVCIIQDAYGDTLMMAYYTDNKGIKFFTEDDDVKQIKDTEGV